MPRRSADGAEEEGGGVGSECSSGCESGWTMYLDQSDEKTCRQDGGGGGGGGGRGGEEEEDLSMVSDASSGPPHYHEEDLFCDSWDDGDQDHLFCDSKKDCKRRRVEAEMQQKQREEEEEETWGLLDDTASSPFLSFPKNNINMATAKLDPSVDGLEISCGFSATHLEGKTGLHDQFNYFRSASATRPKNCREGGEKNKIW